MPAVLDVAIGVVFVFLLFSLVVTAANEIWLSLLDKRAAFLKQGLEELLDGGKAIDAASVLNHGLVSALSRGTYKSSTKMPGFFQQLATAFLPKPLFNMLKLKTGTEGVPSYIPGKSFVLTLLSLLAKQRPGAAEGDRMDAGEIFAGILALPESRLRNSMLVLYHDAGGDMALLKANIENWFNESMDRVGGWYKRYAQQWLIVLAFVLAVLCNVDTIRIIRALSVDDKLRQSVAAQAGKYVAQEPAPEVSEGKIVHYQNAISELEGTAVPIGWSDPNSRRLLSREAPAGHWLSALAGWLLTALAASLGAPFWFDTLNRFVDIRGVGRAPEEKDSTAPKKRSTGAETFLRTGDSRHGREER